MHSHKNTPVPRWLNCAPMHLQSQIQPLMVPTCMNASLHTQNALNQLKWNVLLTHSKCTQPTQISAPLTHSQCTQPTEIKGSTYTLRMHSANSMKCSPYTLTMHSTNSNQDLQCWNVDTCTSNASKYLQRAPIQPLCASKLEMASKFFKTPPRLQKRLQERSRGENLYLQTPNGLQIFKAPPKLFKTPPRSLFMHTSNQTSNDTICMCGPITCWKSEERLHIQST